MAENILGLLLVTSSSRGRNVFRYPPDPFSPHARLDKPSYHPSTFTIKDAIVQQDRRQLFPPDFELGHKRPSTHSASQRSDPYGSRSNGQRSDRRRVREWIFEGSTVTGQAEEQDGSDASSVSSDSDMDNDKSGINIPLRKRSSDAAEQARAISSHPNRASLLNGKLSLDYHGSVRFDGSRRSSVALNDIAKEREKQKEAEKEKKKSSPEEEYYERQYETALAYSLDFLGDMLTPPRSACNRKFEINVDELIFVGHPVTCGPDGKWAFPEEEEELRPSARGRRRARDVKEKEETGREKNSLGTVIEGKEGIGKSSDEDLVASTTRKKDEADGPPSLNMFHLVVILDKPDPKGHGLDHETTANTWTDEVYREIAFKWTAAAFALQVKENWVAKNAWDLLRTKERCFSEGVPLIEWCRLAYEISPMDRSLIHLFNAIHNLRIRPENPLHSYLPTTLTVNVGELPISMILSPRSLTNDEDWAHWGQMNDGSLIDDSDSDSEDGMNKSDTLRIDPWKSLLLVDDDAASKAHEISRALIGLGMGITGTEEDDEDEKTPMGGSRRGSKDMSTAEEDEGLLMKAVIEACDVTRNLKQIAHALRYDLEGIVIPLARELVTNKKAILIDVITTRLRTIVMPTTIAEHTSGLDEYSARFGALFPTLPPLPALLAQLSSSPIQYKDILPADAPQGLSIRQVYMNALIWLLKQDLVIQVHHRARVYARPEIKEIAWRKLWHRRRERWLRRLNRAARTPQVSPIDLITPKAEKRIDPLDVSVPPPKSPAKVDNDTSDYEADSDVNEDGEDGSAERYDMGFSIDELEPKDVPKFEGSFVFHPATAQKDETRWLRAISEQSSDEVWASRFDVCVQFFDGIATFEEISSHTGMKRYEIEKLVSLFSDDIVTFLHP